MMSAHNVRAIPSGRATRAAHRATACLGHTAGIPIARLPDGRHLGYIVCYVRTGYDGREIYQHGNMHKSLAEAVGAASTWTKGRTEIRATSTFFPDAKRFVDVPWSALRGVDEHGNPVRSEPYGGVVPYVERVSVGISGGYRG